MTMKKAAVLILVGLFIINLNVYGSSAGKKVKNIILMVPDGTPISTIVAARIYAYGPGKERLHLETLEQIGYQSTHSRNSIITDSAAAASAWACGQKFNNKEISFHRETKEAPKTILELAKEMGKGTGLVATSTITHATPAAFGAHVFSRKCEKTIAKQFITTTGVDVLLGGGLSNFKSTEMQKDFCGTWGNFITLAEENNYKVVYNREEMLKAVGEKKLLGLFCPGCMTPVYKKEVMDPKNREPGLPEMTRTALSILEQNNKGFFLMVEGSQVDWANHQNNLIYQIGETLEFDRAVKVVLDWVEDKESRRENTLIIVVSDHGCGGFAIKGPYGKTFDKPGEYIEDGWVSKSHTGEDTMIWSQGPYSEHLGKAIDNTDIFHIMKAALTGDVYKHP
ncbi:MAG: alkaline phosphatase [Candidatus Aminicenantes bacterium]|nr:alkaline phosphatase [Candidatus Aminicenantes bacterium]